MKLGEIVQRWYEGRYIPPDNPPGSMFVFLEGHYERHWSSRFAHTVIEFYFKEWKWVIGITLTCIGLLLAFLKLS